MFISIMIACLFLTCCADVLTVQISIAFPDDGAWKRFHKQLQHFPTVFVFLCNKDDVLLLMCVPVLWS